MTVTIEYPRTSPARKRSRFNAEKIGWLFMRGSGVVLIVLIFGHLFVNLFSGEGVKAIDFGFVAGKWASPFWQAWDCLMLWLALIHGSNGMRTLINDYTDRKATNAILKGFLLGATVVLLVLGTLVIYTFDPCPAGSPADLLPSFCPVS